MAFIIEADTPDEVRLKIIGMLERNAEHCKGNATTALTPELRNHFQSQGVAYRMLAHELRHTQIKSHNTPSTTSHDPFAELIEKQRAETKP